MNISKMNNVAMESDSAEQYCNTLYIQPNKKYYAIECSSDTENSGTKPNKSNGRNSKVALTSVKKNTKIYSLCDN